VNTTKQREDSESAAKVVERNEGGSASKDKAHDDRDYSWYGGSIDENAIREIARIKKSRR
jgi:hypothetical protein